MMLRKMFVFVMDHLPTQCGLCNMFMFSKDAEYKRTQWGAMVTVCPKCNDKLIHPYSSK